MALAVKEIFWLAGLLEGEGCFGLVSNNKKCLRITVTMTDKDVIERAAKLLGAAVWGPYGPYRSNNKPRWEACISGPKAAGWMMTLYPMLASRRQAKILELLSIWKTGEVHINGWRPANCHPDRRYYSTNLCERCYAAKRRERRKHAPVAA